MRRHSSLGLSQLELLVSLAVMGLIALFIANSMNFVRRGYEAASLGSSRIDQYLVRDELRNLTEDIPFGYKPGDLGAWFSGTEESLVFYTLDRSLHFSNDGLMQVQVVFENGQVLLILGDKMKAQKEVGFARRILVNHAAGLKIQYFGRSSEEPSDTWRDAWKDSVFIPELIKVNVLKADGQPVPPIVLRPAKLERQRYMSVSSLLPPG